MIIMMGMPEPYKAGPASWDLNPWLYPGDTLARMSFDMAAQEGVPLTAVHMINTEALFVWDSEAPLASFEPLQN